MSIPEDFFSTAQYGTLTRMQNLIQDEGIQPDTADNDGRTALSWAAETGNLSVAEFLLCQSNINADKKDNAGRTALTMAAHYGHVKVVQLLLARQDVNPNWPDTVWKQTPLFRAAMEGRYGVVTELLNRIPSVDFNARDKHGQTPLAVAADRGHANIVKALLEVGVKDDPPDCEGRTAFSRAEAKNRDAVIRLLRKYLKGESEPSYVGNQTYVLCCPF